MLEILNMLHAEGFDDATLKGSDLHVTGPHGGLLYVSKYLDVGYLVRSSNDRLEYVCGSHEEVVTVIRGWRG